MAGRNEKVEVLEPILRFGSTTQHLFSSVLPCMLSFQTKETLSASQGETGLPRAEHRLFPTNMPFGAFTHPRVKQAPSVGAWRSEATWARSEITGSPGSLGEA